MFSKPILKLMTVYQMVDSPDCVSTAPPPQPSTCLVYRAVNIDINHRTAHYLKHNLCRLVFSPV